MPGSDEDFMYPLRHVKVLTSANVNLNNYMPTNCVLLMRPEGVQPGFTMLELIKHGQVSDMRPFIEDVATDIHYISSEKFITFFLHKFGEKIPRQ